MERLIDHSVRIKITNDCQWTCNYCHNEGSEVPENQNKRVSVFLDENTFNLPPVGNITITKENLNKLLVLKGIGINEIHLTGGEPTLHPNLPELVEFFTSNKFIVKITTNGQANPDMIKKLIEARVSSINFSFISFDPEEFIKTQNIKSIPWAEAMIKRGKENILLAKKLGVNVKINTVITSENDYSRVNQIREFAENNNIKLVLLNSIGDGELAQKAVFEFAEIYGTYEGQTEFLNNSKGSFHYSLSNNTKLDAKYIRTYHPNIVCGSCEHNGKDTCFEKFYGIRIEYRENEPYIRLCIQKTNDKTVMPLQEFVEKNIISEL
jgi:cyclic pyranopterin phosphate synthase